MWGEDSKRILGNGSSARDASTSGDNESLGRGADETTTAEEDGGGRRHVTRYQGRRGDHKVREMRKGGQE